MFVDCEHILQRQRLEVESIAGIVVRRDRLRIAIYHDGLVAVLAQSEGCMAAAVVELDSLPDTIRSAAKDKDLLLCSRRRLIFFVVATVEIRGEALELCRAGIYQLVHRSDA